MQNGVCLVKLGTHTPTSICLHSITPYFMPSVRSSLANRCSVSVPPSMDGAVAERVHAANTDARSPASTGGGTNRCSPRRPDRSTAGSIMSFRLVAPTTNTRPDRCRSIPSNSTRSWFTKLTRLPARYDEREEETRNYSFCVTWMKQR